ncbi:MAG: hypothetical protein N4A46_00030 [Schleiferiaceae bacterium]|jgi:hypothetical protein|nr:hypothetical protein [Schleiferiaceae bacterium]
MDSGWFKVDHVYAFPNTKTINQLSGSYIPIKNVWFNLNEENVKLFSQPNENSSHQMVEFQRVRVIEVKGNWSKIEYLLNDRKITGWIQKEDQCGMPWTACNY